MQKSPNILRHVVTRSLRVVIHRQFSGYSNWTGMMKWYKRYVHKSLRHEMKIQLCKGNEELPLKRPYILSHIQADWT
jgi:hypothetical protein